MDKEEIREIVREAFMENSTLREWGEYIGQAVVTKEQCDKMIEQIANKLNK